MLTLSNDIIELLSHHRVAGKTHFPQALTRFQLTILLKASAPPANIADDVSIPKVDYELNNLEAQGEILWGIGKRVCMAQPTVLIDDSENLVGLQFVGDRAYLRLAHQVLATGQPITRTVLRPQQQNFQWIQEQLQSISVRCLTISQSLEQLPLPQIPSIWSLRGQEYPQNPFSTYQGFDSILGYQPTAGAQRDRWQSLVGMSHLDNLSSICLLQTPEKEFLWLEQGQFFEITQDAAYLAMFYMDQNAGCPLRIAWDEQPGRLDLRNTYLPSAYAQIIWRLSQPEANHNRIRLVDTQNRPKVKAVLERLGCVLV